MKYETEIFSCFGCDVILQTSLDLTDKEYKRQFDAVATRIKKILNQIQMHEDYEDLLEDSKRLDQIEGLLVDRMSNSAEKKMSYGARNRRRTFRGYAFLRSKSMTEWDYIFERDWNKYSINAILERKKKDE